jgi:hypothetical protein
MPKGRQGKQAREIQCMLLLLLHMHMHMPPLPRVSGNITNSNSSSHDMPQRLRLHLLLPLPPLKLPWVNTRFLTWLVDLNRTLLEGIHSTLSITPNRSPNAVQEALLLRPTLLPQLPR